MQPRLIEMLSWSFRSKRLRLKKDTKRSVTKPNVLNIAVFTRTNKNLNPRHSSERLRNRQQEDSTEVGQQVTNTWLLRQLPTPTCKIRHLSVPIVAEHWPDLTGRESISSY